MTKWSRIVAVICAVQIAADSPLAATWDLLTCCLLKLLVLLSTPVLLSCLVPQTIYVYAAEETASTSWAILKQLLSTVRGLRMFSCPTPSSHSYSACRSRSDSAVSEKNSNSWYSPVLRLMMVQFVGVKEDRILFSGFEFLTEDSLRHKNHRMVWVGMDIKDRLVTRPCHGPGCHPLNKTVDVFLCSKSHFKYLWLIYFFKIEYVLWANFP